MALNYKTLLIQIKLGVLMFLCCRCHGFQYCNSLEDHNTEVIRMTVISLHNKWSFPLMISSLNVTKSRETPQNGQTHPNNSSALADELFERVWPFCGVPADLVTFTEEIFNGKLHVLPVLCMFASSWTISNKLRISQRNQSFDFH